MSPISKSELIDLLQGDIRGEHAAIIQYLQHAYRLGEGELASEIEEIAREEMRHYKWVSDLVVYLGGDPTVERGLVAVNGGDPADLMFLDVQAERMAIERYRRELEGIEDPYVRRVLERIVSDEEAHLASFQKFTDELGGPSPEAQEFVARKPYAEGSFSHSSNMQVERLKPFSGAPTNPEDQLAVDLLNDSISDEYGAILQYLHLAFVTPHGAVRREMIEDAAIDEMKHMGWFSEEVAELGGEPTTDRAEAVLSPNTAAVLQASIEHEVAAQEKYARYANAVQSPELKSLLGRVRYQEGYHEKSFRSLLERISAGKPRKDKNEAVPAKSLMHRLTVGSLRGQRMAE